MSRARALGGVAAGCVEVAEQFVHAGAGIDRREGDHGGMVQLARIGERGLARLPGGVEPALQGVDHGELGQGVDLRVVHRLGARRAVARGVVAGDHGLEGGAGAAERAGMQPQRHGEIGPELHLDVPSLGSAPECMCESNARIADIPSDDLADRTRADEQIESDICTRPAERAPGSLRQRTGDRLKPTR